MAAWDKVVLMEELEKLGWREAGPGEGAKQYMMIPPETLWEGRPAEFYVYDARNLQELLGEALLE